MKINIDQSKCPANHNCPSVKVCPTGAITQKGYNCPTIEEEKCITCGRCVKYCPKGVFSQGS